ncbi:mannitol dehydrogenase [Citrobacter sp. NCU1]|uniref:mannitol dehydrogenase n=1 Tax=Citrobacter sp. NCU1 TaxID=2026683 RepID=UPI001391132A|nr:mannitol dehydrogenase [Citrobacter sp. NCU1]NDO79453.1 mannitol dehydrogenase [Citrobacter sp. NCU1]
MKPLAIHFGTGALGRGLVIPFLCESGYDVIAVDTERALIEALKVQRGYEISFTDTHEICRVELKDVFHSADTSLIEWLAKAAVITTSVRKENLYHVAKLLKDIPPKTVICCENIEHSGSFFGSQMQEVGVNADGWYLPDCMVDRICSSCWPDSLVIETESWGAVSVQSLPGAMIPGKFEVTQNIERKFQEKRILVNTWADGICFLGLAAGYRYMYEAASDCALNADMNDYMELMKFYLQQEYQLEKSYLDRIAEKKRLRLSNSAIQRDLTSVARNFLEKIRPTERFIFPLTVLQRRNINIDAAIPFLNKLINSWATLQVDSKLARAQALKNINNCEIVSKLENAL